MRLKNGTDEAQAVVNTAMLALRELKEDTGARGLMFARQVALGKKGQLDSYGLTTAGRMSQGVRNVILSAVSARGELGSPLA